MLFYYYIYLLILLFYLIKNKHTSSIYYIYCCIILFLIAAFRNADIDRDYQGYIFYYNNVVNELPVLIEPTFILISKIVNRLADNSLYLFVIYSLFGVILKFYAINRLTRYRLLSVLIYYSGFYLLYEMTQIRVGVAAGLLLLCIKPIKDKNIYSFMVLAIIAFLFHYSAIVIFPLYFLNGEKLNNKLYLLSIPAAYCIYYSNIQIFTFLDLIQMPLIQDKYSIYREAASLDNTINLFNYVLLSRCMLAFLFLWKWKLLAKTNIYSVILIKIYLIAIFIYIAFADTPGISSRISELLMVVEIILIPFLLIMIKQKYIALYIIISIGLAFLSMSLFYDKIIYEYIF